MPLNEYQQKVRAELLRIIKNPHNANDNMTIQDAKAFFILLTKLGFTGSMEVYVLYPFEGLPFIQFNVLTYYEIPDTEKINVFFKFYNVHNMAALKRLFENTGGKLSGLIALYKEIYSDEFLRGFGAFLLQNDRVKNAIESVLFS